MKISTRGRYGTRAMLELALHGDAEPLMLQAIAEGQHLPPRYLEQILRSLRNAGLLRVQRGPKGGFLLSRAPSEINLREILEVLEGDLCVVECVASLAACPFTGSCAARSVWAELSELIQGYLESVSIAALIEREKGLAYYRKSDA